MKISLSVAACALFLATAVLTPSTPAAEVKKKSSSSSSSSSSTGISVQQSNDEGTITYQGKEVWKGKVRKPLIAVSKSENGTELAAAFQGKKVIWENVAGAGAKLEPERKAAARKLPK